MCFSYQQTVHVELHFATGSAQLVFHSYFYRLADCAMVGAADSEVVGVPLPIGLEHLLAHLVKYWTKEYWLSVCAVTGSQYRYENSKKAAEFAVVAAIMLKGWVIKNSSRGLQLHHMNLELRRDWHHPKQPCFPILLSVTFPDAQYYL